MSNRRQFLSSASATLLTAGLVNRAQAATIPEAHQHHSTQHSAQSTQNAAHPNRAAAEQTYNPVVTLNGWTLPYRMKDGVKEFHLVAEPVVREFAPGMIVNMWGYNGQSPGPTLECVEGDRVRIFVTNKLPEHTSVHWHGLLIPCGMDGVSGLNQPSIQPGQTFVYEFTLQKSGTFMYHPHADEMVQMAMGMMGFLVVHPQDPGFMPVDRDYVFLLSAYDIDPGAYLPRVAEMTEFNLWTFNSRVFPGIDPLVARSGERVRIRVGNLTMTNHPIHVHGHTFFVTGTDGGWVPETARWPEVTVDIGVGQMRAIELIATAGDWALHCHKSHHTMNAMGHKLPNLIGVPQQAFADKVRKLIPDYMNMGETGMAEMAHMSGMPLPENTLPMMSGSGPYGSVEMGGMFTLFKVRDDQPTGDYSDPGWYQNPPGTQAHLFKGKPPKIERVKAPRQKTPSTIDKTLEVRKPSGHKHH